MLLVDGMFSPEEFSDLEIEAAFEVFVEQINEKLEEHYRVRFPSLTPETVHVQAGRAYWKLVKGTAAGKNQSVYGFVRKSDGAILKAATWRAPYTRGNNYVRGYVMQDNAIDATTPYGIIYQRY